MRTTPLSVSTEEQCHKEQLPDAIIGQLDANAFPTSGPAQRIGSGGVITPSSPNWAGGGRATWSPSVIEESDAEDDAEDTTTRLAYGGFRLDFSEFAIVQRPQQFSAPATSAGQNDERKRKSTDPIIIPPDSTNDVLNGFDGCEAQYRLKERELDLQERQLELEAARAEDERAGVAGEVGGVHLKW